VLSSYQYGTLADLEKQLEKAEDEMEQSALQAGASKRMLRDTVTVDDISGIVGRWTVSGGYGLVDGSAL
jgi:hypothetical protein